MSLHCFLISRIWIHLLSSKYCAPASSTPIYWCNDWNLTSTMVDPHEPPTREAQVCFLPAIRVPHNPEHFKEVYDGMDCTRSTYFQLNTLCYNIYLICCIMYMQCNQRLHYEVQMQEVPFRKRTSSFIALIAEERSAYARVVVVRSTIM